jgi:hypothetical protein
VFKRHSGQSGKEGGRSWAETKIVEWKEGKREGMNKDRGRKEARRKNQRNRRKNEVNKGRKEGEIVNVMNLVLTLS